jgi:hypothetical protein
MGFWWFVSAPSLTRKVLLLELSLSFMVMNTWCLSSLNGFYWLLWSRILTNQKNLWFFYSNISSTMWTSCHISIIAFIIPFMFAPLTLKGYHVLSNQYGHMISKSVRL